MHDGFPRWNHLARLDMDFGSLGSVGTSPLFFFFWNELGRAADYIKKKEQRPDWVQQNNNKDDTGRLDWDISTATQLHSNSRQQNHHSTRRRQQSRKHYRSTHPQSTLLKSSKPQAWPSVSTWLSTVCWFKQLGTWSCLYSLDSNSQGKKSKLHFQTCPAGFSILINMITVLTYVQSIFSS